MIEISQYRPEDFEQLADLYRNKQAYGGNFDPDRDTPERLGATAAADNLYVAREAGQLLGSFMILDNPHSFWLLRFAIDPGCADTQGVGAALLERASEIAVERGHKSVIIYTEVDDEALNQRYVDLGCHRAGAYRCYWKETSI